MSPWVRARVNMGIKSAYADFLHTACTELDPSDVPPPPSLREIGSSMGGTLHDRVPALRGGTLHVVSRC